MSSENSSEIQRNGSALILSLGVVIGLAALGWLLGQAALEVKSLERSVVVKGLAEREYPADVVIWPIQFTLAGNDLGEVYVALESNTAKIREFLLAQGMDSSEISVTAPAITDKSAQMYGNAGTPEFRYSATQTVTLYSSKVAATRALMNQLAELGKQGIVFSGEGYQSQTEYLFTRLNEIKPDMIQEATQNAREVALKFSQDSNSDLGKIKQASQGQFSISPRDTNNPHIKKIRVVTTVEYYLSD